MVQVACPNEKEGKIREGGDYIFPKLKRCSRTHKFRKKLGVFTVRKTTRDSIVRERGEGEVRIGPNTYLL